MNKLNVNVFFNRQCICRIYCPSVAFLLINIPRFLYYSTCLYWTCWRTCSSFFSWRGIYTYSSVISIVNVMFVINFCCIRFLFQTLLFWWMKAENSETWSISWWPKDLLKNRTQNTITHINLLISIEKADYIRQVSKITL